MIPHAGKEFLPVEGLDDIVVSTCVESLHNIFLLGEGGNENHRDIRVCVVLFELAAQGKTIHAGYHGIEQDNVWSPGFNQLQCFF